MKKYIILIITILFFLLSCDPVLEPHNLDSGNTDFSVYVALGNSLTAGYADNALYREGQMNSFPNLLARQFHKVGGGVFRQPFVEPGPGAGIEGNARLQLVWKNREIGVEPVAPSGQNIFNDRLTGPFHNLGVPGAKSFHLINFGYGNSQNSSYNPFFTRFKSQPHASIIGDAVAQNPTFFTLWIGNNDVLSYATSGGIGNPDGGTGENDITDEATFSDSVNSVLNLLTSAGADGIMMNIPDVTAIPFFTTIPWNAMELTANQAQIFRFGYIQEGVPAQYVPNFQAGANGFVIEDPELTDRPEQYRYRMATEDDYILLSTPLDSLQPEPLGGAGWGLSKPIPDAYTLRASQAEMVTKATNRFNQILAVMASYYYIPLVDVHQFLHTVKTQNTVYDGIPVSLDFVSGGVFSLDGVHLTDRGNAILANYVIDLINEHYAAAVPKLILSDFIGVRFPSE